MSIESVFLLVSAMVAGVVALAALFALVERGRLARAVASETAAATEPDDPAYRSAVRIVWWVASAGVLVGVGIADIFGDTQVAIYALGALSVVAVLVFHELAPARWKRPWFTALECLTAIGLGAALLLLTGYGSSVFVGVLAIPVVAVALAGGIGPAIAAAAAASLAYVGVVAADPRWGTYTSGEVLGFSMTVGALWLVAALASVFSAAERRARRALAERSIIDPLTGLQNRAPLMPNIEAEVRRSRRTGRGFCVLMVDLDGLKQLNDTLGHARGDAALQELGEIIRGSIRAVDSAYRYGGDEFTVLLPETDFPGAFVVAEKIRVGAERMGERLERDSLSLGVSIGLAAFPADGTTAVDIKEAADRALYVAKGAGKNQVSGDVRGLRGDPARTTGRRRPAARSGLPPTDLGTAEAEPDPIEVRRHIESAALRFDSDVRIRQAMDALLSPSVDGPPSVDRIA